MILDLSLMEELVVDHKQIEKECFTAVEEGDIDTFKSSFNLYLLSEHKDKNYTLLLSYHLLYLLATAKIEYYYLIEKLEPHIYDDKHILFVFELERIFYEGNLRKLHELKKNNGQFRLFIELLIKALEAEILAESMKEPKKDKTDEEKNVEVIESCVSMINNYTTF